MRPPATLGPQGPASISPKRAICPRCTCTYGRGMLTYLRILLTARLRSERGATAVEYGLLTAGVALACILGFEALTRTLSAIFVRTNASVSGP